MLGTTAVNRSASCVTQSSTSTNSTTSSINARKTISHVQSSKTHCRDTISKLPKHTLKKTSQNLVQDHGSNSVHSADVMHKIRCSSNNQSTYPKKSWTLNSYRGPQKVDWKKPWKVTNGEESIRSNTSQKRVGIPERVFITRGDDNKELHVEVLESSKISPNSFPSIDVHVNNEFVRSKTKLNSTISGYVEDFEENSTKILSKNDFYYNTKIDESIICNDSLEKSSVGDIDGEILTATPLCNKSLEKVSLAMTEKNEKTKPSVDKESKVSYIDRVRTFFQILPEDDYVGPQSSSEEIGRLENEELKVDETFVITGPIEKSEFKNSSQATVKDASLTKIQNLSIRLLEPITYPEISEQLLQLNCSSSVDMCAATKSKENGLLEHTSTAIENIKRFKANENLTGQSTSIKEFDTACKPVTGNVIQIITDNNEVAQNLNLNKNSAQYKEIKRNKSQTDALDVLTTAEEHLNIFGDNNNIFQPSIKSVTKKTTTTVNKHPKAYYSIARRIKESKVNDANKHNYNFIHVYDNHLSKKMQVNSTCGECSQSTHQSMGNIPGTVKNKIEHLVIEKNSHTSNVEPKQDDTTICARGSMSNKAHEKISEGSCFKETQRKHSTKSTTITRSLQNKNITVESNRPIVQRYVCKAMSERHGMSPRNSRNTRQTLAFRNASEGSRKNDKVVAFHDLYLHIKTTGTPRFKSHSMHACKTINKTNHDTSKNLRKIKESDDTNKKRSKSQKSGTHSVGLSQKCDCNRHSASRKSCEKHVTSAIVKPSYEQKSEKRSESQLDVTKVKKSLHSKKVTEKPIVSRERFSLYFNPRKEPLRHYEHFPIPKQNSKSKSVKSGSKNQISQKTFTQKKMFCPYHNPNKTPPAIGSNVLATKRHESQKSKRRCTSTEMFVKSDKKSDSVLGEATGNLKGYAGKRSPRVQLSPRKASSINSFASRSPRVEPIIKCSLCMNNNKTNSKDPKRKKPFY